MQNLHSLLSDYLEQIDARYRSGISTEHSYRADLQRLLDALCSDVAVINEPRRQACGAPDYIITRRDIHIGYIEKTALRRLPR